jgi:MYXO-CTERM domain-containing protein
LKSALICGAIVLSLNVGALRADIVANGGFEQVQVTGFPLADTTNLPGWTITDVAGSNVSYVYLFGTDQNTFYAGDQSALLNSDGKGLVSISQMLTGLTAHQQYALTFALTTENAWIGDAGYLSSYGTGTGVTNPTSTNTTVAVTLGGQTLDFSPSHPGWNVETVLFTPHFSSVQLTLADATDMNFPFESPIVDSISVSPTPEPGFYTLLALGLAGLAFAVFRRRVSA